MSIYAIKYKCLKRAFITDLLANINIVRMDFILNEIDEIQAVELCES